MKSQPIQPDFPAAHSMDTDWFAVDAKGHVALFCSGEDGAVPDGVDQDESYHAIQELYPVAIQFALTSGLLRPGTHALKSGPPDHTRVYFSVRAQSPYDALFHMALPDQPDTVAAVVTLDFDDEFAKAHSDGTCMGCCLQSDVLYEYSNGGYGNKGPDPYALEGQPVRPLHISALPQSLQASAMLVKFPDVDFAVASAVQPLEHMECHTWNAEAYHTVSGEIREIPGAKQANELLERQIESIRQSQAAKPWWKFW